MGEHRRAYDIASMRLWGQRGEATDKDSPRSCPALRQVRAELQQGQPSPRGGGKAAVEPVGALRTPAVILHGNAIYANASSNIIYIYIYINHNKCR